jgi:hypothetical protein
LISQSRGLGDVYKRQVDHVYKSSIYQFVAPAGPT